MVRTSLMIRRLTELSVPFIDVRIQSIGFVVSTIRVWTSCIRESIFLRKFIDLLNISLFFSVIFISKVGPIIFLA